MPGREPPWWYAREARLPAILLSPVAVAVGAIAAARLRRPPACRSRFPVICVGNFTAGGSGKTPLALLIARLVANEGRAPWFLSRGYGGTCRGPLRVEPDRHTADEVGDEPLLLAREAPTVIARDRSEGARAIEALAPANAVIIMDDGLQNPVLTKDLTIAVIDAERGFGNGRVIPAGPLRAPLAAQAPRANLIVLSGGVEAADPALLADLKKFAPAPIVSSQTRPTGDTRELAGRTFVAFSGIANPERFFKALETLGANVVVRRPFADHHRFTESDARLLIDAAENASAFLITTEKDFVRLPDAGIPGALKRRSAALAIETEIEGSDLAILKAQLRRALAR